MAQYRTIDGDVIDAVCQAFYSQQSGAVEVVLDANPGLAELGPVLSAGILVELPELPAESQEIDAVRLWD